MRRLLISSLLLGNVLGGLVPGSAHAVTEHVHPAGMFVATRDDKTPDLPEKADQCEILFMDVGHVNWKCPRKNHMDPDRTCTTSIQKGYPFCSGYCEVRTTKLLGQEIHFNTNCQPGVDCKIGIGEGITTTTEFSLSASITGGIGKRQEGKASVPLKASFDIGASWSWSTAISKTFSKEYTRREQDNGTCGIFSFVPVFIESCGTLSVADRYPSGPKFPMPIMCNLDTVRTQENWCSTTSPQASREQGGGSWGYVIYVKMDCETNTPLSDGQHPIYYIPGVSKYVGYQGNAKTADKGLEIIVTG